MRAGSRSASPTPPYPRRKAASPTRALWPEAGLAALFPATFYHRTVPLAGAERRISLAFDVLAEGLDGRGVSRGGRGGN